jgi:hypothetical protein
VLIGIILMGVQEINPAIEAKDDDEERQIRYELR